MAVFVALLLISAFLAFSTEGSPSGAPSGACSSIKPGSPHGDSTANDPNPGGFYLYSDLIDSGGSYQASTGYTVKLQGDSSFKGFLIQARTAGSTTPIGSFTTPSGSKHLSCSSVDFATVTHMSNSFKTSITFTWTSPSTAGTVEFRYAVVRNSKSDYFFNLDANLYRPPAASSTSQSSSTTASTSTSTSTAAAVPSPSTTSSTTTSSNPQTSTSSVTPTNAPKTCPDTNKNADSLFPIVFREPDECERESCTLYYAAGPNNEDSNYLDVYMEGTVGGWMALGFSENQLMSSTDVLGCKVVSGTDVEVIDGWNEADVRNNVEDDNQDGICVHMTEYSGMRLKCLFSRHTSVSNAGQDYDLSNPLYIMRGYRNASFSGSGLQVHAESKPVVSSKQYTATDPCPDTSNNADSKFPIVFTQPDGCERASCTLYYAIGPNNENSNYLDVYMEGSVGGWMALGFSEDQLMGSTDVLGCKVASGSVEVLDGWNLASERSNVEDATQDGICVRMTEYTNGNRLKCLFTRSADVSDVGQDFDLRNPLYIIRGYRNASFSGSGLQVHAESKPIVTSRKYRALETCPETDKNADSTFPIVFREPDGCSRESCTLYYAAGPNSEDSNYLDVYMEGTVGGWIALGFSEDQLMRSTDVLGCKVVSGTNVEVVDGWNLATGDKINVEDDTQDGICVHMTEYTGMRLKCLFSRSADITDVGQDFDLRNPLYIIRGYRNASFSGSGLWVHAESKPTVSSRKYAAAQSCPGTSKTASSSFPIMIGYPANCIREINCTAYWAMGPNDQNSDYLDVYLEGNVNGWVGIGFSENKIMAETDVLGCRVNADNTVTVVDGWNTATVRINELDDSQDGICSHTTTNENGRISCLFSRYSVGIDDGQDFDLDNSFYLMTGSRSDENTMDFLMKHSTTPTTTAETYNPMKDSYSNVLSSPTNANCPKGPGNDAEYPVSLGNPGDDYYFGARLNDENSEYLDITLEASAGGWVAVGFSESSNMFSADVLGCKKETDSDTVNVIDTWNPGSSRTNILDSSQDGVCQHSTEYTDNRIKCTFSRLIEISNDGEDLNLNSSLYQLYFAVGSFGGPASSGGFSQHSKTPTVSDQRFSLATDAFVGRELTATEWPKKALIQTHGVFMIISWILLASVGIFYASWMKPLLPNGEWFQVHRAVMVGSLVVGIFGFIFAFIAHARNTDVPGIMNFSVPSKGLKIAHFAFGWIIVVFHVLNPLIALLRCDPGKPKRWIFNLIHGHLIGFLVEMMAFVNVAMGIYLIEKTQATYYGKRALYVFVAFLVGFFAIQLMNFIFYSIKAMGAPEEDRPKLVHSLLKYFITHLTKSRESVTMTKGIVDDKAPEKQGKPGRKQPLEDAPVIFGWISMAAYVTGVVIIVLVLIIMIAVL